MLPKTKSVLLLFFIFILLFCEVKAQDFEENEATGITKVTFSRHLWGRLGTSDQLQLIQAGIQSNGNWALSRYTPTTDYTFSKSSLPLSIESPRLVLRDINADNILDLVVNGQVPGSKGQGLTLALRGLPNGNFASMTLDLPALQGGALLLEDFNRNGYPDLVISGFDENQQQQSFLLFNQGGNFIDSDWELEPVSGGSLHSFDLNNNGLPDLLLSGLDINGNNFSALYANDKEEGLTALPNFILKDFLIRKATSMDFTGNGFLDLIVLGFNEIGEGEVKLLINNEGTLVQMPSVFPPLRRGSISATDINQNGLADILLSGADDQGNLYTQLWLNDGTGNFSLSSFDFPGLDLGEASFLDFENNGLQDIYLGGLIDDDLSEELVTRFYENSTELLNQAPNMPSQLNSEVTFDQVELSWEAADDDLTPSSSLHYSLYIRNEDNEYIVSPEANPNQANLKINGFGNQYLSTQSFYSKLPEGRYFWALAAVDASKQVSNFTEEEEFVICHALALDSEYTLCAGDTLFIDLEGPYLDIQWFSKNANGNMIHSGSSLELPLYENDSIWVTLNHELGCELSGHFLTHILDLPEPVFSDTLELCAGEELSIDLSHLPLQISWFSSEQGWLAENQSSLLYTPTRSDTLVAVLTNAKGCVRNDSVFVNFLSPPSSEIYSLEICQYDTLDFETEAGFSSYQWFSRADGWLEDFTDHQLSLPILKTDTLWVMKTDENGCQASDTLYVDALALPPVDLGSDPIVCREDWMEWTYDGEWEQINWGSDSLGVIAVDTNYFKWQANYNDRIWLQVQSPNGCWQSDTLFIETLPLPPLELGADTALCYNDRIVLETSPGLAAVNWYSLSENKLIGEEWFLDYEVLKSDTLVAEVFGFNGCLQRDTLFISMLPLPEFDLGKQKSYCYGDSLVLEIPADVIEVRWYDELGNLLQDGGKTTFVLKDTESGLLRVEVENENACLFTDSLSYEVLSLPTLNFPDSSSICFGEELNWVLPEDLTLSKAWTSYGDSLHLRNDTLIWTADSSQHIYVEVFNELQCSDVFSFWLEVNPLPIASLGGVLEVCQWEEWQLALPESADSMSLLSSSYEYRIEEGFLKGEAIATDTLILGVWNTFGCFSADTLELKVIPFPLVNAGADTILCPQEGIFLGKMDLDSSYQIHWRALNSNWTSTEVRPFLEPVFSDLYVVELSNATGCLSLDTVEVKVEQPLNINLPERLELCYGESMALATEPYVSSSYFPLSFRWSPEEFLDDPESPQPTVMQVDRSIIYQVFVQAGDCQIDSATIELTVHPLPEIQLTADTTIGSGAVVPIEASGGRFYSWSPAQSLSDPLIANPIARPLATTTYTVEVITEEGCIEESSVTIFVENQLFIPSLFTPNQDGVNDELKVFGAGIQELRFEVYERNGNRVFSSQQVDQMLNEGWDGTYQGQPLPSGTYIWVLEGTFYDGSPLRFEGKNKGFIRLMR